MWYTGYMSQPYITAVDYEANLKYTKMRTLVVDEIFYNYSSKTHVSRPMFEILDNPAGDGYQYTHDGYPIDEELWLKKGHIGSTRNNGKPSVPCPCGKCINLVYSV